MTAAAAMKFRRKAQSEALLSDKTRRHDMTNQLSKLKKRLLQGTKAKCVDGRWSADDLPLPDPLLVTGFTRGLQCWKDGELLDELDERDGQLPDVGELNDQIPKQEWSIGLNGEPEPP